MEHKDQKQEFHQTLSRLVEFASNSGNTLTKEEIHQAFQKFITEDSEYQLIYKYLTDAKINIPDYKPESSDISEPKTPIQKKEESEESRHFYKMYLSELEQLENLEEEQLEELLALILQGQTEHISSLSQHYLPMVITLAEQFTDSSLSLSDLVAEGNLALYEALLEYPSLEYCPASLIDLEKFLNQKILSALQDASNIETGSNRISSHLTDQVNALNDASTELAKELGREATLEELCEHLSLGADEVKELMKISIDALTVVQTDEP